MTIGYVARRLVEAYGRDAARDKAWMRHQTREQEGEAAARVKGTRAHFDLTDQAFWESYFWRSVARACLRVPAPGATP
jgi:hypothetical protein